MTSLDTVMTPRALGGGNFEIDIPDGWQQGRGAYGGLSLGALVRAAVAFEATPERRVRAVTAQIAGPVPLGTMRIEVETVRRGAAVTTTRATLRSGDETLVHAVVVLGADRAGAPSWQTLASPAPPAWSALPAMEIPEGFAPTFTKHFEFRLTGDVPFSGARPGGSTSGYLRPRARCELRDDALVVALADVWWSAGATALTSPRPFATLSFSLDLHGSLAEDPSDAPLYHRASSSLASDGYMSETRELWSPDGRLLALNHQLAAVIK